MTVGEFKNKCSECKKKKESHLYPFMLRGKWVWLCKECWNRITDDEDRINKKDIIE